MKLKIRNSTFNKCFLKRKHFSSTKYTLKTHCPWQIFTLKFLLFRLPINYSGERSFILLEKRKWIKYFVNLMTESFRKFNFTLQQMRFLFFRRKRKKLNFRDPNKNWREGKCQAERFGDVEIVIVFNEKMLIDPLPNERLHYYCTTVK